MSSAGLSWPGEVRDREACINDGAAFLVLADGDKAVAGGHKPLARLASYLIALGSPVGAIGVVIAT